MQDEIMPFSQTQYLGKMDPWICLGAIASLTKAMRLGTMVTPLARRRPWKVAREIVTLDHASHDRAVLGVGLGDLVNYTGKHYQVLDALFKPHAGFERSAQ